MRPSSYDNDICLSVVVFSILYTTDAVSVVHHTHTLSLSLSLESNSILCLYASFAGPLFFHAGIIAPSGRGDTSQSAHGTLDLSIRVYYYYTVLQASYINKSLNESRSTLLQYNSGTQYERKPFPLPQRMGERRP